MSDHGENITGKNIGEEILNKEITAEETDTKSSSGQLREKPRSSAEVCVSPVGNTYPARSTKHPSKAMKNYAPSSSTANVAAWPADVLWKKAWAQ